MIISRQNSSIWYSVSPLTLARKKGKHRKRKNEYILVNVIASRGFLRAGNRWCNLMYRSCTNFSHSQLYLSFVLSILSQGRPNEIFDFTSFHSNIVRRRRGRLRSWKFPLQTINVAIDSCRQSPYRPALICYLKQITSSSISLVNFRSVFDS